MILPSDSTRCTLLPPPWITIHWSYPCLVQAHTHQQNRLHISMSLLVDKTVLALTCTPEKRGTSSMESLCACAMGPAWRQNLYWNKLKGRTRA